MFRVTLIYLLAAATFAAAVAPAFLLRRRGLVGRSGASPTSSMAMRPVTNFFRPTLSKSIVVRSPSDSATIPYPYCSCLMHCPSERTCTLPPCLLLAPAEHLLRGSESVRGLIRTDPRLSD